MHTREELERLGPALAFRLVQQRHPQASRNLLWALAAALADHDWRLLTDEDKLRLWRQVADD